MDQPDVQMAQFDVFTDDGAWRMTVAREWRERPEDGWIPVVETLNGDRYELDYEDPAITIYLRRL